MPALILYAPNVHTGGGAVLLKELLLMAPKNKSIDAILDKRIAAQLSTMHLNNINVKYWVKPTLFSRIYAELILSKIGKNQKIFCFHNIPPILCRAKLITVFFQNKLIVEKKFLNGFDIKQNFISSFEYALNLFFHHKVSTYIVQTKSMCSALSKSFLKNTNEGPQIIPFIPSSIEITDALNAKKNWDFIYISSGDPHKNHRNLIESWKILASENIFPTLALTVGKEYFELCKVIDIAKLESGLKISNLGKIDHTAAIELYHKSKALIYPSVSESFGLPLIEASIIGTPIIAGELDFVRDVCIPSETFDPNSPNSIARSIKRFLQINEAERSFMNAKKFWEHLL